MQYSSDFTFPPGEANLNLPKILKCWNDTRGTMLHCLLERVCICAKIVKWIIFEMLMLLIVSKYDARTSNSMLSSCRSLENDIFPRCQVFWNRTKLSLYVNYSLFSDLSVIYKTRSPSFELVEIGADVHLSSNFVVNLFILRDIAWLSQGFCCGLNVKS